MGDDDDGGFDLPNYTQIPNALFDEYLTQLSLGELRVLLFLLRRTLGFHKVRDAVSLSQLATGTGLNRSTVVAAVKGLEARRLIQSAKHASPERGFEVTVYTVRFRGTPWLDEATSPSGKSTSPLVAESDLQKKRTQRNDQGPEAGIVKWRRRHGLAD